MSASEPFDSLKYKWDIQAKHASDAAHLTPEEERNRRTEWLNTSDNPAAKTWRKLQAAQQHSATLGAR